MLDLQRRLLALGFLGLALKERRLSSSVVHDESWQSGRSGPPCLRPLGTATLAGSSNPGPMQAGPLWSLVGLMVVTLSWPAIRESRLVKSSKENFRPGICSVAGRFCTVSTHPSGRLLPSRGRMHCPVSPLLSDDGLDSGETMT